MVSKWVKLQGVLCLDGRQQNEHHPAQIRVCCKAYNVLPIEYFELLVAHAPQDAWALTDVAQEAVERARRCVAPRREQHNELTLRERKPTRKIRWGNVRKDARHPLTTPALPGVIL